MTTDDTTDARAFWDDLYRQQDARWHFRPNAVLAAEVPQLEPGRALDLGAGEGGDAVWLAEQGWQVTAVDIAQVALDRGARAAAERGVGDRIRWEQADLTSWRPDSEYDLVSSHFLQSPVDLDDAVVMRTAVAAVAVGGRLLVVQHPARPEHAHGGPDGRYRTADDMLAALALDDGWVVERAGFRPRTASFPDGRETAIDDVLVLARRTA